jgi:hypothetical protein
MGKQVIAITIIICLLGFMNGVSSPASVGSAFADSFLAFVPLYSLYKSYANYLFSGTEVLVPQSIELACPDLLDSLDKLQIEIITQTDSQRIKQVTSLARLRRNTAVFCQSYSETIYSIASVSEADTNVFKQAASAGFFSAISNQNKELEAVFSSTLETYTNRKQWEFAVSFSTRTILKQESLSKLDVSLSEILLGPKDAPYPPGIIPEELLPQTRELAALAQEEIDHQVSERVFDLAQQIYDYLMKDN